MAKCPGCKIELVAIGKNRVQCPKCKFKATIRRVYSPPTLSHPEPQWITIYDWSENKTKTINVQKDEKTGETVVFDCGKEIFRDKQRDIAFQWAINYASGKQT